jgi:flagellar protein FlaG
MIIPPASGGPQGASAPAQRPAVASSTETQPPAQQPDPEALRQSVAAANRSARSLGSSVQFNLDSQSGKVIVRVVEKETGQLIRQIPSEEMLELRRALDRISGLVIDETA